MDLLRPVRRGAASTWSRLCAFCARRPLRCISSRPTWLAHDASSKGTPSPLADAGVVLGYHGTSRQSAEAILSGGIHAFCMSDNDYDWLGWGIYFWQGAPVRARQWAVEHFGTQAAVLVARIQLTDCLDLLDTVWTNRLADQYAALAALAQRQQIDLPLQRGKAHRLDRAVLDLLVRSLAQEGIRVRAIRAAFQEGTPIYPQSAIYRLSHVQIAVLDRSLIKDLRLDTHPFQERGA